MASTRIACFFAGRVTPDDYLACVSAPPHLFLDTFPYNAGTTANDALWAGLPIVTLSGRTYRFHAWPAQPVAFGRPGTT